MTKSGLCHRNEILSLQSASDWTKFPTNSRVHGKTARIRLL